MVNPAPKPVAVALAPSVDDQKPEKVTGILTPKANTDFVDMSA